ncbi:hypothetical protein [Bdellovibrio sp. HCB274]|uniref:hypothetical protein n=1 Tax=Bdellovibrio sp. HCB274 TaxID=3394361 RepID=UPI0039B4D5F8
MKILGLVVSLFVSMVAQAQIQSQQQCVTTVRARSMSISSADAEKLCAGDYQEIVNCAVTAKQTSMGSMDDALKKCRGEWGMKPKEQPEAKKPVTDTPVKVGTALKEPVEVPVESMAPEVDNTQDP